MTAEEIEEWVQQANTGFSVSFESGASFIQYAICAAEAAERERLRPWLRHEIECACSGPSDPPDSSLCDCGLAKAMRNE